jgi:1,4-alpha-glucan branching enzyme
MITFVFHTHLPYVLHHGTWPHGSDWLCEAVAECYLPLLDMCDRLQREGIRPGITFDISPVLCEQLAHPDFPAVFEAYCTEHTALAEGDAATLTQNGAADEMLSLTNYWSDWYAARWKMFDEQYGRDIIGAMKRLQDSGAIEIMTCGLTHGYLALLAEEASIDMQIGLAVASYERHFGRRPRGIWLPECAYRPAYAWRTLLPVSAYAVPRWREGIEQVMSRYGLDYFVTDQGALENSHPIRNCPPNTEPSVFDLYRVGGEQHPETAAVFTRNMTIALQVWSGQTGYPGDPDYLDFHKKYYRSALRYWRVTDNKADMQFKQPYVPQWAENRARDHAAHYVDILEVSVKHRMNLVVTPPTVCLPFDTELFGHWWFEGPVFLEGVIRGIHASDVLRTTTASEQLQIVGPDRVIGLPESSWGRNGTHEVWMNPEVQWTWEKEYHLEHRIRMLVEKSPPAMWDATMRRIMINVFRQLLLAQASDWQFLITTFSSKEYAEMRFHNHISDAQHLCDMAERYRSLQTFTKEDDDFVTTCEGRDGIFTSELEGYLDRHV